MTHTVRLSQFEAMKKERDVLRERVKRLEEQLDTSIGAMEMFNSASGASRDGWDFSEEIAEGEGVLRGD